MDMRTGKIRSVTRDNDSWIRTPRPWERLQDPARIEAKVRRVLAELLETRGGVAGIGLTGQMHGILYVRGDGAAAGPLYTWQDGRGGLPLKRGAGSYAEGLSERTGYRLAPGFGMVTHGYNLKNGLVPRDSRGFCTIHDYLVMRLAGRTSALMDPTDAASLGVFDLRRGAFDRKVLAGARIGLDLLPEIAPSGTFAGTYQGIPVYTALGDNQASFLGSVRDVKRTLLVNIGTGGQVSAFTDRPIQSDELDVRPFPGGGFLLVGALLCGGKAYALLESFFRQTLAYFGQAMDREACYARMAAVPYDRLAGKLAVDTRFAGTRLDPTLRGAVRGVSIDNLTPEHLIAGFLDGIADELDGFYAKMPEGVRRQITLIAGSGNGIRRNALLRRIVSRRLARRLRMPAHCEEASVGAALTAAVGAGCFEGFQSAGRMIRYVEGE